MSLDDATLCLNQSKYLVRLLLGALLRSRGPQGAESGFLLKINYLGMSYMAVIVYFATKNELREHLKDNYIDGLIEDSPLRRMCCRTGFSEVQSWRNSLQ